MFFNTKNFPQSNNDPFDIVKNKNSFRVFVLGGSTTAGFPFSPNGTFTRYIRDRLELNFPDKIIEVINLGISAINTYTILDLLPGVIEQKPDLIIIYAGHNEYYGALGVASTESIGSSSIFIKLYLYLTKYKTFQLIKDAAGKVTKLFSSENNNTSGTTLMAKMASEKTIKFESELYNAGAEQFRNNLNDILSEVTENKIPIIIGSLVSNLKDQKPFISTEFNGISAEEAYQQGLSTIQNKDFNKADSLFKIAKDLDGLRFRAPEEFNKIIFEESKNYNANVIDIASKFNSVCPNNIVGSNLMVDHLHPTLEGYLLMGKWFFDEMTTLNLLPGKLSNQYSFDQQDSIVKSNFAFTRLDSVTSNFRILNLLNDFPFVKIKNRNAIQQIIKKDKIDSLGYKIAIENFDWKNAHQKAAEWYLKNKDYKNFAKEIKVIISQQPFNLGYYNYAAEELIKNQQYDLAMNFLKMKFKIEPDNFSSKWLGNIYLFKKEHLEAIKYLNESLRFEKMTLRFFIILQ
ncbi:MAG: hypothetical protein H6613_10270 [Ignavibacteriales bacterium]|nr:hypothetical protein [Ignavibacteriales bacterium]